MTITSSDDITLIACLAKANKDGYKIAFTVSARGLSEVNSERFYTPDEIKVKNFYRFEGASDPSENAILYLIKTSDGHKGTLTDAYGIYANPDISAFMEKVEVLKTK